MIKEKDMGNEKNKYIRIIIIVIVIMLVLLLFYLVLGATVFNFLKT